MIPGRPTRKNLKCWTPAEYDRRLAGDVIWKAACQLNSELIFAAGRSAMCDIPQEDAKDNGLPEGSSGECDADGLFRGSSEMHDLNAGIL
ncbi:hypothetical protein GCM10009792_24610 [Microcella alkalica]